MTGIGNKRGIAIIEHTVLAAVIVLSLCSMNVYISRAIKGKIKSDTDTIGPQYSSANSNYSYREISHSERGQVTAEDGDQNSLLVANEVNGNTPYVDDFSDKALLGVSGEAMFE